MDDSHLANQWADNPTPTNQNSTSPVDEDGKECSLQKVAVNNLESWHSHCSGVSEIPGNKESKCDIFENNAIETVQLTSEDSQSKNNGCLLDNNCNQSAKSFQDMNIFISSNEMKCGHQMLNGVTGIDASKSADQNIEDQDGKDCSPQHAVPKNISPETVTSKPENSETSRIETMMATKPANIDGAGNGNRKKVRVVCISDTHDIKDIDKKVRIPNGDILIHAGDFTLYGSVKHVVKFNEFLGTLPHKHKIVIAGNHELCFDGNLLENPHEDSACRSIVRRSRDRWRRQLADLGIDHPKQILTNCTYLEDSWVVLYGLRIYGSPWVPEHRHLAFNLSSRQELCAKWDEIPDNIDILVTHGPAYGILDRTMDGERVGCPDLLDAIQRRIKPKYHICGHIHEAYGTHTDGVTNYINTSLVNKYYQLLNKPTVFDIPCRPAKQRHDVYKSSSVDPHDMTDGDINSCSSDIDSVSNHNSPEDHSVTTMSKKFFTKLKHPFTGK